MIFSGLMITSYAKAATALNIKEYKQKAINAAEFLKTHVWDSTTHILLRSCYVDEHGDITNL